MRQECPASKAREPDKKMGFNRRNISLGAKKCFNCGEFGHMAKDNKCQPDKKGKGTSVQMYTAREVIQEDDEEDEPSKDREEGEEFEFEYGDISLQEEGYDNDRRGVHTYALRTETDDYWWSDEEGLSDAYSWELKETEGLSLEEEGLPSHIRW
jgi:Zinc knuckle